jgi:hypothetical protein
MGASRLRNEPEGVVAVTEGQVPPSTAPEGDPARGGEPPRAPTQATPSDWTAGRIVALVAGIVLALIAIGLVGAGGTALWAQLQKDGDYVTTDVHTFSTSGSALVTDPVDLGQEGVSWLHSSGLVDSIRIRVTPTNTGEPLFVGIARSADVDRYLAGVSHTVITDYWDNDTEFVGGDQPNSDPATQGFWAASTSGSGNQTLVWNPEDGTWTAVVMNADGGAGLSDVRTDLGGKIPSLPWITLGLFVAGAIVTAGSVLLIVGAIRRRPQPRTV